MINPIVIETVHSGRITVGREQIIRLTEWGPTINKKYTEVELSSGKKLQTEEALESLMQRINRFHPEM